MIKFFLAAFLVIVNNEILAESPHVVEANRFAKLYIDIIQKEYDLKIECYSGEFWEKINVVYFDFVANRSATEEQARKEIIQITDKLIYLINSDEKIKPYLKHTPFSEKDVKISIEYLKNPKNKHSFSLVWLLRGYINYYPDEGAKPLSRESFLDGKAKLNLSK